MHSKKVLPQQQKASYELHTYALCKSRQPPCQSPAFPTTHVTTCGGMTSPPASCVERSRLASQPASAAASTLSCLVMARTCEGRGAVRTALGAHCMHRAALAWHGAACRPSGRRAWHAMAWHVMASTSWQSIACLHGLQHGNRATTCYGREAACAEIGLAKHA